MKFTFYKPSGLLAQFIRHFWVLEAGEYEPAVTEYIIPTGNIEIMFHFRQPFITKNCERLIQQPKSFVSGLSSAHSEISTQGASGLIAVTFYPHGAGNFLPFPLLDAEDRNICLRDVFNKEVRELEEQLHDFPLLDRKIAMIESFLLRRYKPIKEHDLKTICEGVKLIGHFQGNINPALLSDKLSLSPKNLERKFSSLLGKTPKQYIRIVRFQHILKTMSETDKNLTQLAYHFGYFDQAHFIKDFKMLSGFTPRDFMSRFPDCPKDYFV